MIEKTDRDVLFEYMPAFSVWYKFLLTIIFQILIFISVMIFFWWASSIMLIGALIGQIVVSFIGALPYRYMFKNCDKIREKYHNKYGKLAGQYYWYRYQFLWIPVISASFYFPIFLKTDYFLPAIIPLPFHLITNSLFSIYVALLLGIFFLILGSLIRKSSARDSSDVGRYLHMIYPKQGRLITYGINKYIRHPQFLWRVVLTFGFCFIANNIIAFLVGLIHHLIVDYSLLKLEDEELIRRFGNDAKTYQKNVPILFPRFGNWRKFLRFIFLGDKN